MSKKLILKIYFDERKNHGSGQHYWHFMFGYFLPLMEYLLNGAGRSQKSNLLLVQDFGPIMTPILKDALKLLCFDYQVITDAILIDIKLPFSKFKKNVNFDNYIVLPRWDIALRNNPRFFELRIRWLSFLYTRRFMALKHVMSGALTPYACCDTTKALNAYLILKRSSQPSFYDNHGMADRKGYGQGRRSLHGIEEATQILLNAGIPVLTYEPGLHNLSCQMTHFSKCAGVIGIRGAEFANLFWMRKGGLALLIQSAGFSNLPAQKVLARVLGLTYRQIYLLKEVSPELPANEVLPFILSHMEDSNENYQ